jgi:hypothetical protein
VETAVSNIKLQDDQVITSDMRTLAVPALDLPVKPKPTDTAIGADSSTWEVVGDMTDPADGLYTLIIKPIDADNFVP